MLPLRALAALLLCTLPATAGTWTVDDDGPADFATIQEAIDAASSGDVVHVQPGLYKYFTLDKALVLVGEPGALVNWANSTKVTGIHDGTYAGIAGIDFYGPIQVSSCSVPVVLDGIDAFYGWVSVSGCADVRVRDCVAGGIWASGGSRLEVIESASYGDDGWVGSPDGGPGSAGLRCDSSSVLHAYRTTAEGGDGGDGSPFGGGFGGEGGDGVSCAGELLLAGDAAHTFAGGDGGEPFAPAGKGLHLDASAWARVSGVTVQGTSQDAGATLEQPVPADPALRILAPVGPGENLTFRLHAEPGATAELLLGRLPTVQLVPGPAEDLLVSALRELDLGTVAANGTAGLNFQVPAVVSTGFLFFAQARVTLPGGEERYTNSVPIVVR